MCSRTQILLSLPPPYVFTMVIVWLRAVVFLLATTRFLGMGSWYRVAAEGYPNTDCK